MSPVGVYPRKTLEERFWAKVERRGPSECWLWTGAKSFFGYGQTNVGGRHLAAHRASFLLANGRIDPGLWVLHSCDNPPCVNPAHLSQGTAKDNIADVLNRGRFPIRSGESHPNSSLSTRQVLGIRAQHAAGVNAIDLAKKFGISRAHVYALVSRRAWRHV